MTALTDNEKLVLYMEKRKTMGMAYLLWIIGGLLGMHRIYLQDSKIGISQCIFRIFSI